jgi:hypothetical protein
MMLLLIQNTFSQLHKTRIMSTSSCFNQTGRPSTDQAFSKLAAKHLVINEGVACSIATKTLNAGIVVADQIFLPGGEVLSGGGGGGGGGGGSTTSSVWRYANDPSNPGLNTVQLNPSDTSYDAAASFVFPGTSGEGAGTKIILDQNAVGAVRAGRVDSTQWDAVNRGDSSVAFGRNGIASGQESTISGGLANTASGVQSTVGGGTGHNASGLTSTVGGGFANSATNDRATVAGGGSNFANGDSDTVAGGLNNGASGSFGFVGGGVGNRANAFAAVVCGGQNNTASGDQSAVLGGIGNVASGTQAVVLGGSTCTASNTSSICSGQNASDNGFANCFVWSDSLAPTLADSPNEVVFGAGGGVKIYTTGTRPPFGTPPGVRLFFGSTAWAAISDRNAKENLVQLDGETILQKILQVPIYQYNYIGVPADQLCRGPVAQDWHTQFPSGKDPLTIDTMDLDGISLAAIHGLAARIQQLEQRIVQLETQP